MKITTQFILTLSFFLLILIGMAVSLIYTNQQVERLYQQDVIAHHIERGADELSYLTGDYLMYGESQQRARWESRFASFSEDVSGLELEDPAQQAIVAHIEADRARMWAVFEDIAGTLDRYAKLPDARPDPAFTRLSWSRMEVQIQAVAFETSLLSQKLLDRADRLKQMNLVLMFSLIGVFGFYLLSSYYLIYRRTLRSIAELHTGTQIIGSGNLDFTIPVKRMDEIGELSLAFNKMTASLKEVTASKADLEREIAERQQAESRLQAVMESSPDPIFLKDRDSRFLLANPATFAVIGKPAEAVLGKTDAEFYDDPATGRAMIENDRRIMDSGRMEVVEESISDEKGTRVFLSAKAPYFDPDGQVIGLVGVARDITERKRAEQALRASENRLRKLVEGNIIGVDVRDAAGQLKDANSVFLNMVGYTCMDLAAGRLSIEDLTPPAFWPADQQAAAEALASGACQPYEKAFIHKDGRTVPAMVGYTRLDESGDDFIGFVLDLSELKQAQAALQDYTDKLKQSNRELEQFAFVASHDLQEPLRKIRMFGNSLQQKLQGSLDENTRDGFQRMLSASERMQAMIDDLLQLSRVNTQVRPFVPVDLSAVAAEVVSDLEPRILRSGGQVVVEALPCVEADPIQIHQVLQNVIANGLKFHKPGTPPIVKVSPGTVNRSRTGKGEMVSIRVEDNGIGFEEQKFEKILQPFQRLHGRSEYEGTGIGLAIVKKIIERHHGEISAHSTPGEGSTFIITLPVKQAISRIS